MRLIYKVPIVGGMIYYVLYGIQLIMIPLVFYSSGGVRLKFGNCVIWVPKSRKQIILEGLDKLKAKDRDMNLFLTQNHFIFFYSLKPVRNSGGRIYGLEEQFIKWGAEGVAVSLVQSALMFKACPSINRARLCKEQVDALKLVPESTLEWMRQHSFRDEFINAHGIATKKWQAQELFFG
jgi:hypothetical protein